MPDDLSSIEGLADKHVRALARQHVTDLRGLVQADPEAIYRAMANLRPRPTREQISRWQDEARNKLADAGRLGMADGGVVRGRLQPAQAGRHLGAPRRSGTDRGRARTDPCRSGPAGTPRPSALGCAASWARPPTPVLSLRKSHRRKSRPRRSRPRRPGRGEPAAERRPGAGRANPGPRVPGPVAHRQRRAHRRGRADGGGDGGCARREPAHRAGRAGPRGLRRRRRAAGNAAAGGRPHPAPGRTRLEPPGSGGPGRAGPGRVRPDPGPGGRPRDGPDRLGARRHRQAGLGQAAQRDDPPEPG